MPLARLSRVLWERDPAAHVMRAARHRVWPGVGPPEDAELRSSMFYRDQHVNMGLVFRALTLDFCWREARIGSL